MRLTLEEKSEDKVGLSSFEAPDRENVPDLDLELVTTCAVLDLPILVTV